MWKFYKISSCRKTDNELNFFLLITAENVAAVCLRMQFTNKSPICVEKALLWFWPPEHTDAELVELVEFFSASVSIVCSWSEAQLRVCPCKKVFPFFYLFIFLKIWLSANISLLNIPCNYWYICVPTVWITFFFSGQMSWSKWINTPGVKINPYKQADVNVPKRNNKPSTWKAMEHWNYSQGMFKRN